MNCFEWQNRVSDFLDGTLIGTLKRDADDHLEECKICHERHEHYRQILASIASQPRNALPVPIRKSPLSFMLPKAAHPDESRESRWERTPWFVRTSIEGFGIAFMILLIVALVPRVRRIYERNIERSLDSFTLSDLAPELAKKDDPATPAMVRGNLAEPAHGTADDFAGEGSASADNDDSDEDAPVAGTGENGEEIHVGNSEVWRFNIRSDSPRDLQPKIVQILTAAGLPAQTPGLGGIEAPGGIQFDLIVPKTAVGTLMHALQKVAAIENPNEKHDDTSKVVDNSAGKFTWYKNKSKREIPSGKSRVVIWLSQI